MRASRTATIYRPRASTPTGVIIERAAARADATGEDVTIKVPGTIGAGLLFPIKPGESAGRRTNQADTVEAMRPESYSEGRSIVLYCSKGASSAERVNFALTMAQHSKMPVIIQGVNRRGRSFQVVVLPRSEAHRKVPELINARR